MKKYFCDFCGRELEDCSGYKVILQPLPLNRNVRSADICGGCVEPLVTKFENWEHRKEMS